jgi:hypothetical protein
VLENILKEVVTALDSAKEHALLKQYGLIGGMAVARWGIPRATLDFDFFISVDRDRISDLAGYLNGTCRIGSIHDPLIATITLDFKDDAGSLPVELIVFPVKWDELMSDSVDCLDFEGIKLNILNWKSLVLLKLYAGSARDLEDAKGILEVQSVSETDREWLKRKANSFRVSKKLGKVL